MQIKSIKLLNIRDAYICVKKIQQSNKLRNSVAYLDAYFLLANITNDIPKICNIHIETICLIDNFDHHQMKMNIRKIKICLEVLHYA